MQRFKILKNNLPIFSGSSTSTGFTGATGEQLQFKNNYYVYSSEIGNSTVNDNNVRDFLDDERNADLATDFVSYLQSNSTLEEFKDIFYDNKKLSSVFNSYYSSRGLPQNNLIIKEQVKNTTAVTVSISTFDKNNNRINVNNTFLNTSDKDANYFIPVYIQQDRKLLEDGNYAQYFKDCNSSTYDYKRYTFINNISNNVVFGNSAYINSIKSIDNLGYSQLEDSLFENYSVGNLNLENTLHNDFQTFSQFEKRFDFKPPIITNSFPGFFISQSVINLANGGAFHVFGYNNYNYNSYDTTIGFTAQFRTNSLKFYDKSYSSTTVPVTIELSRPSIGNSYFTIKAESYSTATLLSDFYFNNTNSDSIQVHIQDNYKDITIPLKVTSNLQPEESIVLSMRSGETIISYLVLRGEDIVPVNNYSKDPTLLITSEKRNKLMLRCFVDYNFDDNESAFYHNNIHIIDETSDSGQEPVETENERIIQKVANTLRIGTDDIKNLYIYGSELYGTNHIQSDFDLIAVINTNEPHQNIVSDEFNIQVYSEQQFKTDLQLNNFPAIEMKFVPSWAVIKESFELDVNIKKPLLKDHGIKSALENLNEAKASASNMGLKYLVKKRLFHAYRKLLFVEQLLKFGKINDFNAADSFRGELSLLNINSKEDINSLLQVKFNKKINEIKVN